MTLKSTRGMQGNDRCKLPGRWPYHQSLPWSPRPLAWAMQMVGPLARISEMKHWYQVCAALILGLVLPNTITAQQPTNKAIKTTNKAIKTVKLELMLRAQAECPSNLLLLSDLVHAQGSDALIHQIADVPLAPAPRIGNDQTWTRSDIEKSLSLRGISSDVIRWQGAMDCIVRRVEGQRSERSISKNSDENNSTTTPRFAQPAGHQELIENKSNGTIDKTQFTTPFITPTTVSQAERIAAAAIENYLQTKTASTGRWEIQVQLPSEHAKILTQRRQILGIAGGQPPWEGKQTFIFLIKGPVGEQSIDIPATVKLPEMVVAANRPLAKGYVLRDVDLTWIPMPRGLNFGPEDCFSQTELLAGQQLRRAMSTQQVIRLNEVGPPVIIHVGDLVAIGIVSGGVTVETNGRAIEPGAMDDLIQIEVQPHRKRVLARVTGDRTAEVLSNGTPNSAQSSRKNASTTSSLKTR